MSDESEFNELLCYECSHWIKFCDDDTHDLHTIIDGQYTTVDAVICEFCGCSNEI